MQSTAEKNKQLLNADEAGVCEPNKLAQERLTMIEGGVENDEVGPDTYQSRPLEVDDVVG